ncbi:DHA2 family efflux MFS transporter permease subunit [Actinoallomurus acaciae]|uniref:DHA2 family efflux MFS transporter permease subunit n=1 Tax=Actinoallomurus acaciae TaxID=502577 RepID=A0ABV5Y7S0_9ACTN
MTGTARDRAWALALTSVGSFMVILDMLVVATALSAIQRDFHASLADLEWTVTAYSLSFAALLMTASVLGDRFGRRRIFAIGLALFGFASAACARAPSIGWLIVERIIQGTGAAVIMPMALALLNAAFPPQRRGWAIGVYGGVTGLGALLGPIIGGAVTEGLSWQWIFWLNVPIAAVAIPLVLTRLPESRGAARRADLPGLLVFSAGVLALVWGLVRGGDAGWGSGEVVGTLVAGLLLVAVFVGWQRRTTAPMIPLRLFRSRAFSAGNVAIFFLNASMSGAVFLTAQFQQIALGHGPLNAALRLLPWGVAPFLIAPLAGSLAARVGARRLAVTGLLLQGAGMGWTGLASHPGVGYATLVVPISLSGIGFAAAIPILTRSAVSDVDLSDVGTASGVYSTFRQLGGAFGVAVLGALFAGFGGYDSAAVFSDGYTAAMLAAAAAALIGATVSVGLPTTVRRLVPPAERDASSTSELLSAGRGADPG